MPQTTVELTLRGITRKQLAKSTPEELEQLNQQLMAAKERVRAAQLEVNAVLTEIAERNPPADRGQVVGRAD